MSDLTRIPLRRPVEILAIGGEPSWRRRLLELGFLPGVEVTVIGVAPLGDPLHLEVRGCRFSIRKAEAAAISVAEPRGDGALALAARLLEAP